MNGGTKMEPKRIKTEKGIITGRNGTWDLTAVELATVNGRARIDGVGQRGTTIRGGLSFDAEAMDIMAFTWIKHRYPNIHKKICKQY